MRPVQGGTQKLTMNSKERDYQQKLRQTRAQGDGNQYVVGVQEFLEEGGGEAIKATRNQRGDVTQKPGSLIQGPQGNFAQKDTTANDPLDDPHNQTASLGMFSATQNPNRDPQDLADKKLVERLEMYQKAGSNANYGNNNRSETMRLG